MKKVSLLGVAIDSFTRAELIKKFREALHQTEFHHIATVNPEFLVATKKSADFLTLLQKNTWLNLCDGAGIQLLAQALYRTNIVRISGVETAEILCKICEQEKKKVALIGGFGVAKKSADFLQKRFPKLQIVYAEDGDPNTADTKLKKLKPDAVLVAFGAPKQEFWLQKHGAVIGAKIGIGIGGTFDFWTGKAIRAPKFLQKIGLEWLWRLILEPKRLPRIITATVIFPVYVCAEKITTCILNKKL